MGNGEGEKMTCIAGLVHEGKVYIGADSAGVSGYDKTIPVAPKVFRRGGFIVGYTSVPHGTTATVSAIGSEPGQR